MRIDRLGPADVERVLAGAELFDEPPTNEGTRAFLDAPGHHLLVAVVDGRDVGFVSGIETWHPDKPVELLVYELGVDEAFRRRGIATALLAEAEALARSLGCGGMWVVTEPDNTAANATYRSTGATVEQTVTWVWSFD